MNDGTKKALTIGKAVGKILLLVLFTLFIVWYIISVLAPERWEYKVVSFVAESPGVSEMSRVDEGAAYVSAVNPTETTLDEMGQEGWEVVGSYLEMETAWPNFGDPEYVIGLQPNVRPHRVVVILKRPKATWIFW